MDFEGNILDRLVKQSTRNFKDFLVQPFWLSVEENKSEINRPEILTEIASVGTWRFNCSTQSLDLNNDILILTNKELDLPITAVLTLESLNNLCKVTKTEYTGMTFNKYQVFSGYLKIHVKDYGNFVPFNLEFLRIIPKTGSI